MEIPPGLAVAVVVDDGRLLLIHRAAVEDSLAWALPGGKVEARETAAEAAVREAQEEAGVSVEAIKSLGGRIHPDTGRHITYVACRVLEGEAGAASPREVSAVDWVEFEQIPEYVPRGLYAPLLAYVAEGAGPGV
ncbi:NUDIX domain-containing protein [Streptomyces sp. IBSBF 2953]|uniref:NUDIX hydrolase n=1 Tax=Streptomyces sp. B21-097 TaxID=3039414 RepID=UPI00211A292D|nr:NUDIX domain-containing protein [Streptomyces hayashii]